jgi:hypothetical protein
MTLKSAFDDLTSTTLQAVSGLWARLEYVSGLRSSGGGYAHWGLAKVHGEQAAQKAIAEAHRATVATILKMPLRDLSESLAESSRAQGLTRRDYLERLYERRQELLPVKPAGGAAAHLNSVLYALLTLESTRHGASRPNA